MKKSDQYKDWLNSLTEEQIAKLEFFYEVAHENSFIRFNELLEHFNIKQIFAERKYKSYPAFAGDELFKASEELISINLIIDWREINIELKDFNKELKDENGQRLSGILRWTINKDKIAYWIFMHTIYLNGLATEYLNMDIDFLCTSPEDYDIKNLREFDKVVKLLTSIWWIAFLSEIEWIKPYDSEADELIPKLTFSRLFKPEFRAKIPSQVIRLLGPGEADAWEAINNKKKWVYKGIESAIIIPFYLLCDRGFIVIPSREKKEFLTVWLREFGKDYKPKTFDKRPSDYEATEYFKEYLNKL